MVSWINGMAQGLVFYSQSTLWDFQSFLPPAPSSPRKCDWATVPSWWLICMWPWISLVQRPKGEIKQEGREDDWGSYFFPAWLLCSPESCVNLPHSPRLALSLEGAWSQRSWPPLCSRWHPQVTERTLSVLSIFLFNSHRPEKTTLSPCSRQENWGIYWWPYG